MATVLHLLVIVCMISLDLRLLYICCVTTPAYCYTWTVVKACITARHFVYRLSPINSHTRHLSFYIKASSWLKWKVKSPKDGHNKCIALYVKMPIMRFIWIWPVTLVDFRNIVCTVNLCCKLDLKKIALHARNAEYNPKRFAAVIMRIRDPRTTALIFSSGKMVCTGAKR